MVSEERLRVFRIVSLVASTAISLASGTNYVYSAYAPQLAERLHLSATESNLIGTCGNLGMYLMGIPSGIFVDTKGPRPPVLVGALALLFGYYPIYLAMAGGKGVMSVGALCFFSALTGLGSCLTFGGALKAAALNFPHHRGTATAIPLSAFGLSAFFFSTLSSYLFPGNSEDFLLVLALATSGISFICFFFLSVIPRSGPYTAVPSSERLHRTKSEDSRHSGRYDSYQEPGTNTIVGATDGIHEEAEPNQPPVPDETSSFLSRSSSSSDGEDVRDVEAGGQDGNSGAHVDIRGWNLARNTDFWLFFAMVGCLTGVGLMTINNIGHDAQALWAQYDPSASPSFVQQSQGMHVSLISIGSFLGRITGGITSDIIHKKYGFQRLWLMVVSGTIFACAQIAGLTVENPNWLWLLSSFSGVAYGILFGCAAPIVSEKFGLAGMSQNWGTLTLSAVISGNIFNLFYGRVYDDHSEIVDAGHRECSLGLECYRNAYIITFLSSILGLLIALAAIQRNRLIERHTSHK